jgi:hypothetical protein
MGAFVVILLVVAIVVGVLYYKKNKDKVDAQVQAEVDKVKDKL